MAQYKGLIFGTATSATEVVIYSNGGQTGQVLDVNADVQLMLHGGFLGIPAVGEVHLYHGLVSTSPAVWQTIRRFVPVANGLAHVLLGGPWVLPKGHKLWYINAGAGSAGVQLDIDVVRG
jgi:hypothetical protein